MSLWDELPGSAGSGGALDTLETVLQSAPGVQQPDLTDGDGTWHIYRETADLTGLGLSGAGTPIEFRDPHVTLTVGRHVGDDGWRIDLTAPVVAIALPFLTPARYDVANALLVPDPSQRGVFLVVGGLTVRLQQLQGQDVKFSLVSASTSGDPTDQIYDLIRMEPGYAIVGPGNAVGFGFRGAVLDLSDTAGPSNLPAGARTMPNSWQGFFLPEIRLFVQPNGLDGLHVTAAARDLYIGVGASAGVTGIFEVEVVNGASLSVEASFLTPTGPVIPAADGSATVPASSTLIVSTHGGSGSNTITITPDNATAVVGERAAITTDADGTSITVTVHDATAGLDKTLTLHTALAPGAVSGSGSTRVLGITPSDPSAQWQLQVDTLDPAVIKLSHEPPAGATIAWTSPTLTFVGPTNGPTVTVDLASLTDAAPIEGDLSVTFSGAVAQDSDCYFLVDHPKTGEFNPAPGTDPSSRELAWVLGPDSTRDTKSPSRSGLAASGTYLAAARALAARIPHGTHIEVDGYASYEATTSDQWNKDLSARRRSAAIAILKDAGFTDVQPGTATGDDTAHAHTWPATAATNPATAAPPESEGFWWLARARVSAFAPVTVGGHLHAEVSHWSNDTPPAENTPARPAPPSCFRRIGVRVELLRSSFIRAEVWGELDVSSAAGQVKPGLDLPPGGNPGDGIVDFLARMRITEDRQAWSVEAEVKSHAGDVDGLYQRKRGDGIPDPVIDGVGAMAVIAPLTAAVSSLSPAAGAAVALVGAGLGASGTVMRTQEITLYGVDVLVSHGIVGASGEVGDPSAGERVSVLFDVETQFMVDVKIIRTTQPVKARYKAIGMAATWGAAGAAFTPTFVFDPDKGYTIDAPDGSVAAVSPLDQILRVFGFKVSRDNPMFIEIQFGIGLEIGIITIDTATVRATFQNGGGAPDISISRLRATIDVPGTLHGTGEVSISENLIGGAFDITVTPVSVRIAASLYIAKGPDGNVGVLFGGLVELPVPIVLGSSGLGIYGFLGGMGVNFERVMPATALPALDWAKQHLANNTLFSAPDAWQYSADHYGFAAGLVLGTVDGGFTLNMKGVLLIEVPGPRIGLIMLANILSPGLPGVTGDTSATILAVIDLDFGRGTILIALRVDYDISGLITFHVPVTAFFDTKTNPSHWYVELGSYADPVSVQVLGVFEATGYLGVYGDGKTLPTDPVLQSEGLTFAVGFHVSAVLMGYKPSGLYLEASGGFDALLAPDPMYLGGIFEIGGELRLFIISISAWAKLVVIYRDPGARLYVHGEAHGKVDFFFFSVEGSVELTIGSPPANDPGEPPPLVSGVSLIARSTQVTIEGSASSGPVDGSLGKAAPGGVGDVPVVPIDVVPLVEFAVAPKADAATVVGGVLGPWTAQPYNPWVQVGGHWWRYDVTAVRLTGGALLPPTSPAPAAWWVHGADGNGRKVGLGLLTWVPVAQPAAVPYGENLVDHVTHVWGEICSPPAGPAPQLWTFDGEPTGPDPTGWFLTGLPWPDPPGATRSTPVRTGLRVGEAWRVAGSIDPLQGTAPAVVVGGAVPCFDGQRSDPAGIGQSWAVAGPHEPTGGRGLTLLEAAVGAAGLYDAGALLHTATWRSSRARAALECAGEILRSPALDSDEPAPHADDDTRTLVKKAWEATGFQPDELADAVWFEPQDADDGFTDVGVLLLVDRRIVEGGLFVVGRAADGSELRRYPVRGTDLLSAQNHPSDHWFDPDGPWADPVSRAGHLAARIGAEDGLVLVWAYLKGMRPSARRIVVGFDRARARKLPPQPFYVVGVESVLESEARRYAWDVTVKSSDQTAVSTALAAAGTEPLLTPNSTYAVEIDWTATAIAVSGDQYSPPAGQQPAATLTAATVGGSQDRTQSFTFRTGAVPTPPSQSDDLTPWVLATEPDRGEDGLFTHAGITVTFSSQRVTALYAAYGKELFVQVRAASGHHPRLADQPGTANPQVTVDPGSPYLGTDQVYGVQQPWREALGEVVTGKPCIDQSHIDAHDEAPYFLPYVFDPLTEYLLDVHARPSGTAGDGEIVFRAPFTTGRFTDLADLARYVSPAPIQHRGVLTPGALTPLVGDVTGAALDQAFEDAGLGAPQVPAFPLVQVLWTTDPTPQPVAVVVESNERLVRTRVGPKQVVASTTDPDPVHHYWARVPYRWLSVVRSAGAGAAVDRIAVGPGGTRVVAFLAASQRGTTLNLDLQVTRVDGTAGTSAHALSVLLAQAPWEEEA